MKVLLEFMKSGGNVKEAMKATAKKYTLIAIGCFFLVIFIAVAQQAFIYSALCNDFTSWFGGAAIECPTPPVDEDALKELGEELHKERKKVWDKLADQKTNQRFETIDEVMDKEGLDDEPDIKYDEAEYFLRIMLTVDANAYSTYVKGKDLKKGGALYGSSIDKSLDFARELYEDEFRNWLKTEKKSNKGFNKGKIDYLMAFRVDAYRCFLLDECGAGTLLGSFSSLWEEQSWKEKYEISMGIDDLEEKERDKYKGIATKAVEEDGGKNFQYKTKQEMLDLFCEISFFQALGEAGIVEDGKALCQETLAVATEEYKRYYTLNNSSAFASFGWLVPMEDGTYNFSSPYGMRTLNGVTKMHNGVDMGTLGVADVPIYATKAGKIIFAGWNNGGYGGVVTIDHGNGYYSTYNHMDTADIVVKTGDSVQQGQLIGAVDGKPNLALHLHFEICTSVYRGSGKDLNGSSGSILCDETVDPESKEFGLIFNKEQDNKLTKERANEFVSDWKEKALSGEVIIMPGFTGFQDFGFISAYYESGGYKPDSVGLCVHPPKDHLSCGKYQIATTSTLTDFIQVWLKEHYPQFHSRLKNAELTLASLGPVWKQVADEDPVGFEAAQMNYLMETHYYPKTNTIMRDYGYNTLGQHRAIQEMVYSFGVNLSPEGFNTIWERAVGHKWESMTDEEIIFNMYREKYRYAIGHDFQKGLQARACAEYLDIIDILNGTFTEHHPKSCSGNPIAV